MEYATDISGKTQDDDNKYYNIFEKIQNDNYYDISAKIQDDNYYRHVGWNGGDYYCKTYFSEATIRTISSKITDFLQGVDPEGRSIVVPDKTILSVMSDIYKSYKPPVGDIHSRLIVSTGNIYRDNYIQNMIDQTIEVITSYVKNTIGIEENNKKLTIWTTVYGDFNRHGLQQTPQIKIRNKHPTHFQFHMRY